MLLFLIIIVYIIPIIMVYIDYKDSTLETHSVSSIICNQNIIFYLFIILFCFLCVMYEINRNDMMSCCYVIIIKLYTNRFNSSIVIVCRCRHNYIYIYIFIYNLFTLLNSSNASRLACL